MADVTFSAPGPGVWELEQTHFTRPASRLAAETWPESLARGFAEGTRRYGLLLDTLELRPVNDFMYTRFRAVGAPEDAKGPPPKLLFQLIVRLHPEMRRRTAAAPEAISRKLWRDDLRRWDEEVKPDSVRRNQRLQSTRPERLSDDVFQQHLGELLENQQEMVYRHHIFTISSTFPVGHYLSEAKRMTGLPSGELLGLLKGSTPVSRGIAADELVQVTDAMRTSGVEAHAFLGVPAATALERLREHPAVGPVLEKFLDAVGYRMVTGYDICDRYALELPEVLLRTLFAGEAPHGRRSPGASEDRVRERVPSAERAKFDELLGEARFVNRLRDERGVYNDLWGAGLLRRGILEAGRRLVEAGVLPDAELAVNATHDELVALLRGSSDPTAAELRRRQLWRETKTVADAPPFLGGTPSPPPPVDWLPKQARANARAVDTMIRELFDVSDRRAKERTVEGLAVHPGIYEGPVRLVKGPEDFDRIQKGDVLVTRSTGPSFNVVLPLLGAIVTDRGGQLSHAAIVAREYGIPAVVGTREATTTFMDGARVRVDGDHGRVEMVAAS
jgi:phosphohistidine swiveling domain-containing protein